MTAVRLILLLCGLFQLAPAGMAEMLTPPDKAARFLFPEASEIKKESLLLTAGEKAEASKIAKAQIHDGVFTFYRAKKGDEELGFGGIFTSTVRTKNQTSMVGLDPNGKVLGIEVIAYYEPPEYLPQKKWLELFKGKKRDESLRLGQDIPIVTGATMTTEAMTEAVRIVRAVWEVKLKKSDDDKEKP
ncbi:MAG: FMN-binding protein [Bdellovibrionaceae bacterium]|nr:FMN-binding protein [Bdellovibrionales bacterium]MCB9084448.1 FMN-binding protein [Pseudobdellovibrionaceae bacterium]